MNQVIDYVIKKAKDRTCRSTEILSYFGIFNHSCNKTKKRKLCKKCVKNIPPEGVESRRLSLDYYISTRDYIELYGDFEYYKQFYQCTFINSDRCLHPKMTDKEQRCTAHHCVTCYKLSDKKLFLSFLSVPYAKWLPKDIKIMIYNFFKFYEDGNHKFAYKEGFGYTKRNLCPNKAKVCNSKKTLANRRKCDVYFYEGGMFCSHCDDDIKWLAEKKIFDEKRRFINNYVFETLPKIQATDPYFGYILEHLFTDSTKITLEELNNKLVVVSSNPNMHVKNTLCFLTDKICAMAKVELDNSHSKLIEYRYKTILNSILPPKIGPLFAHILN